MYLKSLQMSGFKSFAEKTKLSFEPGMTAIVGPNGCGKSNISDAIRWVLGEKSAKALRGSAMTDVIFTGTDTHKPMGLAEVSLTLADCEAGLGLEYNEVTVTRRVQRSGESTYLINRTPCRLKDIQRLFMDTGIGTNSYSLMEQGRIDLILSSRPEDRRAVFEEASGITKFKADKKEALRKLDHTEANLLRLDDIIREVRRQIISLQRQAGKARRYQTMQDELRALDLFFCRERLAEFDERIQRMENQAAHLREQDEAIRQEVQSLEAGIAETRSELGEIEAAAAAAQEAASAARSEYSRAGELIRVNADRIVELQSIAERDSRDAEDAQQRLAAHRQTLEGIEGQIAVATEETDQADRELVEQAGRLQRHEQQVDDVNHQLHTLRSELLDLDNRQARLQNQISELEAEERTTIVRRERLAAEKTELGRAMGLHAERQEGVRARLAELERDVAQCRARLEQLTAAERSKADEEKKLRARVETLQSAAAGKRAQIELLEKSEAEAEGFPGGARLLLDEAEPLRFDRRHLLGSLADHLHAEPEYRTALEAVMRAWLDALVVRSDAEAAALLAELNERAAGSARLLAVETQSTAWVPSSSMPGTPLLQHVRCSEEVRSLTERLLGRVFLVDDIGALAQGIDWDVTLVTRDGALRRGSGSIEYWKPGDQDTNPVARRQMLVACREALQAHESDLAAAREQVGALQSDEASLRETIREARHALEEAMHQLSVQQGESRIIDQQSREAAERLDTVSFELDALNEQDRSSEGQRTELHDTMKQVRTRQEEIRAAIGESNEALRRLESERSRLHGAVSEHRVRYMERKQRCESLVDQKKSLTSRIAEVMSLIQDRESGLSGYQEKIEALRVSSQEAEARLAPLQQEEQGHMQRLEGLRAERGERGADLAHKENELHERRERLEETRTRKSSLDVELAEDRLRRQTLIERAGAEHHVGPEEIREAQEPQWENGERPDAETLETNIGEIRARLESMGPVNLVAIEEHRELEERYAFLTQQQEDLVNAKQQLMDMIRQINATTTELFTTTFNAVNENFQQMFKRLFGGGTARLVLVDEQDVLESGIEIIARPPGKKLQSVSLLSGGERTMTAVALLFSVYQVKPSPFCVLDELDAALDDANVGRFVEVVKGFLAHSQFVIITHNRKTITAADTLYGVTMEQRGVSKIVSVKLADYDSQAPERAKAAPEPAATPA